MRIPVLFLVLLVSLGCGQTNDQPTVSKHNSTPDPDFKAKLEFTRSLYEEHGGRTTKELLEDTDMGEVKSRISDYISTGIARERILLTRTRPLGSDLVVVDRNEDGTYEIGVNTKIENRFFEAGLERHDQPQVLVDLFQAFVEKDPTLTTIVAWDFVAE